ncbi:uncharacterized protein LOC133829471 [Humulus lupulus]|uniref:uncharacterized protein LOC133829471 n=1 Tax=Humulus lupulus TaxID=3486 RepID=UPI002B402633|nr:uncharacterized protein LOC133829471 [Humulus lupulus]
MDPENIDWNSIESVFVEDGTYENIKAPKWVDLSAPDELVEDDEAWFCNSNCKHPKTVEDFSKQTQNSKVKFLRSLSVSEALPFRARNQRDVMKTKSQKTKGFNFPGKFEENSENSNPNISHPLPFGKWNVKKNKQEENLPENSSKAKGTPGLKSTFSARDLFGGRDLMNQITELCSEIKKFARKGSKKGGVLDELKQRVRDRERKPLIVKEK